MKNAKIKMALAENNLRQWQLARIMHVNEYTLSRKFRDDLPEEEQNRIVELIRQYARQNGGNA